VARFVAVLRLIGIVEQSQVIIMIGQVLRSLLCGVSSLLFALLWPACAAATTYAVGSGAGCTHATVQEAINAAVIDTGSGPHLIKLTTGTISVPNGLTLHNAVTDIIIEGGYSSCAGTLGSNTRTVLDAAGGADGTVLDIRYFGAPASRSIHLSRLDITGGTGESGIFDSSEGAGLELRGNLQVFLEQATHVRDNRANRGAGILIQGGPGFVDLTLRDQSSISGNIAATDGGGVWCYNLGVIELYDASVDFNQAGRDGGGIWLGTQCALIAGSPFSPPGEIVLLDNNSAGTIYGGRGGAVFYQSSLAGPATYELDLQGTPTSPILLINNRAMCNASPCASGSGEGGAIYAEGLAAHSVPMSVKDTTFYNNSAGLSGSAISVKRGVRLALAGSAARCNGLGFGLCSAVVGGDTTAIDVFDNVSTSPAVASSVDIRRTRFTANAGRNVINAFAWYNNAALLAVVDSIFDNNTVGALIDSDYFAYDFRYTTVVANTLIGSTIPGVFGWYPHNGTDTGYVTLDGSIIWQPGAKVMYSPADASRYHASHFGCLLVNNLAGVQDPGPVRTANPQLDANFVPGPTSPALDVCNGGLDTELDAYGTHRPVDQSGIPNALGPYDLGAVERPLSDAIFADGFQ
jgi:hypothetical protein